MSDDDHVPAANHTDQHDIIEVDFEHDLDTAISDQDDLSAGDHSTDTNEDPINPLNECYDSDNDSIEESPGETLECNHVNEKTSLIGGDSKGEDDTKNETVAYSHNNELKAGKSLFHVLQS